LLSTAAIGFTPVTSFKTTTSSDSATDVCDIDCKSGSKKSEELDQRKLFNMIRRGVVAIDVIAHVIVNKLVNEKMWHGTGFIVDLGHGLIVTNAHIAGEISVCTYRVKFGNGQMAEAKCEYIDPSYDFAILSVKPSEIPQYCIALKCSETPVSVNSPVYSMGNSSRNEFSTYPGCVFDTESILWLKSLPEQSFQFSGLTVGGASGSPVFNSDGEVVGVLYGGKLVSGAALPISYVTPVFDAIKNGRKFTRYFCGCILDYASIQDSVSSGSIPEEIAKELAEKFPNSNNKVICISKKLSAFGANENEAMAGDVIWMVNGVITGADLKKIDEIMTKNPGKNLAFTVYRDGVKKEYELPVYELKIDAKMRLLSFAGVTFFETTNELKINLGKSGGGVYFVDSEMGSPFAEVTSPSSGKYSNGVFQLVGIDGYKISSLDDLWAIIPEILKKKVITIRFIRLGLDSQEMSIITKHTPDFATAALYTFDQEDKRWIVKHIES
jgi:S1-C subfamily serine protease